MKAKSARNKILAKAVWVGLSLSLFVVGSQAISLRSGKNSTGLRNSTKLDFWDFFESRGHTEDDLEDIMFGPTINDPVCGVQRIELSRKKRIFGGHDAGFGTFPWQVLVKVSNVPDDNGTYSSYKCGGALVDRQHVVTAGHCVDNFTDKSNKPIFHTRVYLGEYNRLTENEPLPMQWRDVDKIYVHPYFRDQDLRKGGHIYDVAVIKFDTPIQYANHIVPICLPEKTDIVLDGTKATVSGWGITHTAVNRPTAILQAVDVKVFDNQLCQDWHREQGIIYFTLKKDQMCAGHEGGEKDACQGDSGGPLMTKRNDGRWFLIGVVSYGFGCGELKQPGQFHRVGKSSDWISFITKFLLD